MDQVSSSPLYGSLSAGLHIGKWCILFCLTAMINRCLAWRLLLLLGQASVKTIYSYLGYYNVCHLGGEIRNPRTKYSAQHFHFYFLHCRTLSADEYQYCKCDTLAAGHEKRFYCEHIYGKNLWRKSGRCRHRSGIVDCLCVAVCSCAGL